MNGDSSRRKTLHTSVGDFVSHGKSKCAPRGSGSSSPSQDQGPSRSCLDNFSDWRQDAQTCCMLDGATFVERAVWGFLCSCGWNRSVTVAEESFGWTVGKVGRAHVLPMSIATEDAMCGQSGLTNPTTNPVHLMAFDRSVTDLI